MVFRLFLIPITILGGLAAGTIFWPQFVDIPSLLLTLGGALGVTAFSYSKRQRCELLDAIKGLVFERQAAVDDQVDELSRLTGLYRVQGLRGLEKEERSLIDPFLKRGVGLLVDLYGEERIHATLQKEIARVVKQQEISRQILMTLGKLLPSFGLIGTLIGMVLLLRNLSGQEVKALPSALGLAVLTTLYGAVFANVIVAPLAARVHAYLSERETQMRVTLDWVLMMCRGEATAVIANKLSIHSSVLKTNLNHGRDWAPVTVPD